MVRTEGPPPQGIVLWRGPSLIDGQSIVCIATGLTKPSANAVTGPMIQTWVLREGIDPVAARRTGEDRSVCGDCALREGGCYVILHQAPLQVWRAFHAGLYPALRRSHEWLFRGRHVRAGSYGDPAAVPTRVWSRILRLTRGHTGYTHHWRTCDPGLRKWLMASVETPEQLSEARSLGWRTFRIRLPSEPLLKDEFICPKSDEYFEEKGHRLLCLQCEACRGGEWTGQGTPAVIAHGGFAQVASYGRLRRVPLPLR
jgi:hypothetical protein